MVVKLREIKRHILCVDDDQVITTMASRVLTKRNYKVTVRNSIENIDQLLRDNDFDIILLDIQIGNESGIDLLKNIRKTYDSIQLPVIMVTGEDQVGKIIEALDLGANDYIRKPVNFDVAEARMNVQFKLSDLTKELMDVRGKQSVNAMIVTYNHEIGNPLVIAKGFLKKARVEGSEKNFDKVENALDRIQDIVANIQNIASGNEKLEYQNYANSKTNMIKLKKGQGG